MEGEEETIINNDFNIQKFDFIKDKYQILLNANEKLNLNKSNINKIIFVYSAPKVGSTSIVSSLRIFGSNKFTIIHVHDEEMLKVLGNINDITVNEIILFNKYLGKEIYVIDIYRSPIERKISVFFEKIGSFHFNNVDSQVKNYNISKIIKRFNNIFNYIGIGDHFIDKYDINTPDQFDYNKKFLLIKQNGINYIKLRLKDSNFWGNILTNIFKTKICIVKDYESTNKPIKKLYNLFKMEYKIPKNYLDSIMNCKYLNYYYSAEEKEKYFNDWFIKCSENFNGYNLNEYKLYDSLTNENCHINYIQIDHYLDEGCICKACSVKRMEVASLIQRGLPVTSRILHNAAKNAFLQKRFRQINKINRVLNNLPPNSKPKGFKANLNNLVKK
jgi:hypothetical protein